MNRMSKYTGRKVLNEQDSIKQLIAAMKYQAVKDYTDWVKNSLFTQPGNNKEATADAEVFLSMKNEDGSYVFPFDRIKYNTYHGVRMFIIHHFSHLPDKWMKADKKEEYSFECPICGGDVHATFSSKKSKNLYFKHKCEKCGFQFYTFYSCTDTEYVKRVKEYDFKNYMKEQIYEVEKLEFEKIHDNDILDYKEKTKQINERIEWWKNFKNDLGF